MAELSFTTPDLVRSPAEPAPPARTTWTGNLRLSRPKVRVLFPSGLPADAYGLVLEGDCLTPLAGDRDLVIASPTVSAQPGELVVVWPHVGRPSIKRLAVLPMPLPPHLAAASDVRPAVIVATLTPPRVFAVPMRLVASLHGVVGLLRPEQYLGSVRGAGRAA